MKAKQFFPSAFVLLIATTACTNTVNDIEINEKNFPDENFRAWILEQEYGKDSILTAEEIAGIDTIEVCGDRDDIKNLKGIEYFTALTYLDCLNWPLIELDVSKNTKLKDLSCGSLLIGNGQLTVLDISKNKALTKLYCGENKLTELNLSECTLLTEVDCNYNQLTELDISKNYLLTELDCAENLLTTLDVSKNSALTYLSCDNNQLTSLDLSGCTSLNKLYCYQNQIRDAAMDALVKSLPNVSDGDMLVIYNENEQNKMTKKQVAAAKAKGWIPKSFDGENWQEYAGSED